MARAGAVAVLLALWACSSGGGSTQAPPAPTDLKVVALSFDVLQISWTPPAAEVDGFELEARIDSGPWERAHDEPLIGGDVPAGIIEVYPETPELLRFGFRIRSARGSARSDWTPEAVHARGIRPPMGLTATIVPSGAIALAWTNASAISDTLLVERADANANGAPTGAWTPLPVAFGATAFTDLTPKETFHYAYRVRNGKGSTWSAEAFASAGPVPVRPPTGLTAALVPGEAIALAWTNASEVADAILVERADANAYGGLTGAWTPLPVAFGATAYMDLTPKETIHHAYRVRYGKGSTWSVDALASAGPVPVRPPADLAATVTVEGVSLTWTNRSEVANAIEVRRWPDGAAGLATLAEDAAVFVDTRTPVWPSSHWTAIAVAGEGPGLRSEATWVGLAPLEVAGPDGALRASAISVPETWALRRSGDGRFVHLEYQSSGPQVVVRETANGAERHTLSVSQLVRPYLELDGAGRPHVVGYDVPTTGPIPHVVHEWLGADGWTSETIATPPSLGSATKWGVDATGALTLYSADSVCTPSGGAWSCEDIPNPPGWSGSPIGWELYVSRDGTALLAGMFPSGAMTAVMAVATRRPGETVSVESLPSLDCGYNADPRLLPDEGGDLGLLCHKNSLANPPGLMDVHYTERRGGTWSALDAIGGTTVFGVLGGAATPGISRVHVWTAQGDFSGGPLVLWSRGPNGWTSEALTPSAGTALVIGHLDTGEVWCAARPADYSFPVPQASYSLWEEAPAQPE